MCKTAHENWIKENPYTYFGSILGILIFIIICPGSNPLVQQIWWVVWSPLSPGQRRLGAFKLRDPSQLPGEALLVPRSNIQERGRVSPVQRNKRKFPGPWVWILAWPEVNISPIRGQSLPLQDPAGRRGQLCTYTNIFVNIFTQIFSVFCHGRVEISYIGRAGSSSQHSQRWSHYSGDIRLILD